MKRRMLGAFGVVVLIVAAVVSQRALGERVAAQGKQMPVFQVDPTFFKPLPNNWVTGQGSAIAVDKHDNVWWFHRPQYVPADKKAAPAVLEFDSTGKFIQGWGGPSSEYEWFDQEHGIYIDENDNVWLTGSARVALGGANGKVLRNDNMLLKFTNKGKFLMQIGHRDTSTGNNDKENVYSATDLSVYKGEVYVADGYVNHRVIVFDAENGKFKRMWGAFGNVAMDSPNQLQNARTPPRGRGGPEDPAAVPIARGNAGGGRGNVGGRGNQPAAIDQSDPGPMQFVGPVHSAKVAKDGMVYVADRSGNRLQVFTIDGKYVKQTRIESPSGFAISSDPQQRFLYIAQYGVSHIAVLDRQTLELLYQFGVRKEDPGNFRGPHELSVDSKGNLYVAEVEPGNRWQKFTFKGLSATPPPNALTPAQLASPSAN